MTDGRKLCNVVSCGGKRFVDIRHVPLCEPIILVPLTSKNTYKKIRGTYIMAGEVGRCGQVGVADRQWLLGFSPCA